MRRDPKQRAQKAATDLLASFFARNVFLPHGYGFYRLPGPLWAMVGADAVIAAASLSIPLAILSCVRKSGPKPTGTCSPMTEFGPVGRNFVLLSKAR